MDNKELIKVIDDLWNNYDAFLFYNKYEENTHKKQFELLEERFKQDEMSMKAIKWIKNCYDCFYKEDFNDDKSAFAYLKKQLED
jgi:hypothetical protein